MAKATKSSKQSVNSSKKRREKFNRQFARTESNLKRKNKTNKKKRSI